MLFKSSKRRLQKTRKPADYKKIARRRKPKIDVATPNLLKPSSGIKLVKVAYTFILLSILGVGLIFFFFSTFLSFDEVVFDHDSQYNDQIAEEVMRATAGRFWGMIPKSHLIFLDTSDIERALGEKFKGIDQISVKRKLPKKLQIGFKDRNGLVLICKSSSCVSLSDDGVATTAGAQSEFVSLGTTVETVSDQSQKEITVGDAVNTNNFVSFVREVRAKLSTVEGIGPQEFYIPHPSATELKIKTQAGWLIYMDTASSLNDQVDALGVLLEKEITKEDQICIEYIDQRIPKRIFYKLVDDCEQVKKAQPK